MRITKPVFFAVIGLAMLEFSFGLPYSSLAAAMAARTSHAPAKSAKKSHAVTRSHKSDSPLEGIAVCYSDKLEVGKAHLKLEILSSAEAGRS